MNATLRNDFHNTSATVRPINGVISAKAMKRAAKKLCGMSDCRCGVIRWPECRLIVLPDGSAIVEVK